MGVEKLPVEKINIRSPFFITADSEGAPDLSTDCPVDLSETPVDISDPTNSAGIPEEYQQPDAKTETVECGTTVNIGTDVGVTRYNIEVGSVTGDVDIDYTVNVPISITGFWDVTVPDFSSTGYVGNDDFEHPYEPNLWSSHRNCNRKQNICISFSCYCVGFCSATNR